MSQTGKYRRQHEQHTGDFFPLRPGYFSFLAPREFYFFWLRGFFFGVGPLFFPQKRSSLYFAHPPFFEKTPAPGVVFLGAKKMFLGASRGMVKGYCCDTTAKYEILLVCCMQWFYFFVFFCTTCLVMSFCNLVSIINNNNDDKRQLVRILYYSLPRGKKPFLFERVCSK